MTPEQKMRKVVEAAGECWHDTGGYINPEKGNWACCKCEVTGFLSDNSSPTDLNELFRLARKAVDLGCITFTFEGDISDTAVICWLGCNGKDYENLANTPAEALLNALYESVKEAP